MDPRGALCAYSMLVADVHGLDTARFGRFWYDLMNTLVRGRVYKLVLSLFSPSILLRTTAARWGIFHQGLQLSATATDRGLQLDLVYPARLVPRLCVEGYTQVWQSLLDHSSIPSATARLVASNGASARYHFDGFR